MALVYALIDSSNPTELRYIGKTKFTVQYRFGEHLSAALQYNSKYHVHRWIRKVLRNGGNIATILIETDLTEKKALRRETHYIDYYRSLGHRLTNMTDGGKGTVGYSHTEETKNKIGHANSGKVMPESAKQTLREINTGKTHAPKVRAKMSKTITAHYEDPVNRERAAARTRKRFESQEERDKQSQRLKGRKQSPEHTANAAAARARNYTPRTQEQRNNMRNAQLGRKQSPEHVANVVAAKKEKKRLQALPDARSE